LTHHVEVLEVACNGDSGLAQVVETKQYVGQQAAATALS